MNLSSESALILSSLLLSLDGKLQRSMAVSCNAAFGSLVDVDIPELSESP